MELSAHKISAKLILEDDAPANISLFENYIGGFHVLSNQRISGRISSIERVEQNLICIVSFFSNEPLEQFSVGDQIEFFDGPHLVGKIQIIEFLE